MIVKYNLDEYIVSASSYMFRIPHCGDRYIIEKIEPPCNDLTYICEFDTLGECLEYLIKFDIEYS